MKIKVSARPIDYLKSEGLALVFFSDEKPPRGYCGLADWRLNGAISELIKKGVITGSFQEKTLIGFNRRLPSPKTLLIGLGASAQLDYDKLYITGHTISKTLNAIQCDSLAFDIPDERRCNLQISRITKAMISGFYDYVLKKKIYETKETVTIEVLGNHKFLGKIILGMHEFKVNKTDRTTVDIIEAKE